MIKKILTAILLLPTLLYAQINTERVMTIARNALYFEDYVLSIQYFNPVSYTHLKMAMNVCMFCRTLHIVCKA